MAAQEQTHQLGQEVEKERIAALEATRLKDSLQTEVVNLQNQIGSLQTSLDNEKRENDAAKERSAQLATELTASQAETAALKAEVETERRAKELVQSEKDRLSAELVGISAQLTTLRALRRTAYDRPLKCVAGSTRPSRRSATFWPVSSASAKRAHAKAEEINALLTRNRDARQEISRLSSAVQESRSQENIARFKVQGLEQEIQLIKKDAEWAHEQLLKLNESSATFRASKRAELSRVQADLDTARQEAAVARSKVESLQKAYNEASTKLSQTADNAAQLSSRLASQEDSFRSEISSQASSSSFSRGEPSMHRNALLSLKDNGKRCWNSVASRGQAWAETEKEAEIFRKALQQQNQELSEALDRLAEGVGIGQGQRENGDALLDQTLETMSDVGADFDIRSTASTPRRVGLMGTAASFNNAFGISPTAEIANASASLETVSARSTWSSPRRKRSFDGRGLETNRLTSVLAQVMDELQDRAPQLQAQREETNDSQPTSMRWLLRLPRSRRSETLCKPRLRVSSSILNASLARMASCRSSR